MVTPADAAELAFEKIAIGDTFEIERVFETEDIAVFAKLSGDYSPLHMDPSYAATTEFGGCVVHGMLLASLFSTLIGMHIPGRPALYLGQDLTFRNPVAAGQPLIARAKVIAKSPAMAMLSLATDIRSPEGRIIVSGTARVKVRGAAALGTEQAAAIAAKGRPVAVVTGGTSGIGAAISRALANDNYLVLAVYRGNDHAAADFLSSSGAARASLQPLRADVTTADGIEAIERAVSASDGALQVLVNCATAPLDHIPAEDLSWPAIEAHLDVQVKAVLALSQGLFPRLSQKGGSIVNLLSQVVHNTPPKNLAHYVTAKYALMGLSKALAAEWAGKGVRVNMISPGLARTELTQHYQDRVFKAEAVKTPLGRLVEPLDVAHVVRFLVSDAAAYITGANLPLSGGQTMG
jgi:3-oxoacyl-[acyl-carrier protein] reductase